MKNLYYLRKSKKLTQKALAGYLNMSQNVLSNYENGQREPPISTMCALADFFGVSVDYLIGHDCTDALAPIPEYARVYEALSERSREVALAYMKGLLAAEGKDVETVIFCQKRSVEKSGEN